MPIDAPFFRAVKRLAFASLLASLAAASFSNSFFEIFSGIFLTLSLVLVLTEKRTNLLKNSFAVAALLYLLVVLLSVSQSAYPSESWRGVFRVVRCVMMAWFTVYLVDDEEKFKKSFFVFMAAAFLIAVDAIAQGVFGLEALRQRSMTPYYGTTMRVTGPFNHPNDLAAYLSIAIFLFLGLAPYGWQKKTGKLTAWSLVGTLTLGTCLLWTYSRGAWVAVVAGIFFMAMLKRSRILLFALLGAGLLVYFLSPPMVQMRIRSLGDFQNGSMNERKILWDEALRMTYERPWLGYGINTYSKIEPTFKAKDVYPDYRYAHNGYLQMAAETGWLGLAAFLGVILSFVFATLPGFLERRRDFLSAAGLSLVMGIVSFLIDCLTDTGLQSLRLVSLFWLSMGLALAAKKISEQKPS